MDPLTTALLAAIAAAAGVVAGGVGEAAGGDAWAATKTKLAGWMRLDDRQQRAAFERAAQKTVVAMRQVLPGDTIGQQALELLEHDTPERRAFLQVIAEELLFQARPNIGRLVDSYRRQVRFRATLRRQPLPAWGELEPRLRSFIELLRRELHEEPALRPLVLAQAELEALDAARATARATAASAESLARIEALVGDLLAPQRLAPTISAGDGATISNSPLTVVFGDHHSYTLAPISPPDFKALYRCYCEFLASKFGVLDFRGIVQMQNLVRLRLEEIYVPLRASGPAPDRQAILPGFDEAGDGPAAAKRARVGEGGTDSASSPVHDLIRDRPFLVLLGDPGAGKSTVVRTVMLALAEGRAAELGLGEEWLPIFFPVAAFAEARGRGELAPLAYLHAFYAGSNQPDYTPLFERALASGRALVLMDGLDEVREDRLAIVRCLEDFIRAWDIPGNRFLATSRIAGYDDAPLDDALFVRATAIEFGDDDIRDFAGKWSLAFERAGAPNVDPTDPDLRRKAAARAEELARDIFANPSVTALARNPLLLTILALIHNQGTRLPDRRIDLYRLCVEALAETWNRARGLAGRAIQVYLGDEKIDERFVVNLLGPAALWIHAENPGGIVEERDLARKLAEILAETDGLPVGKARRLAEEFIELVNRETGLLQERGHRRYGFLHLTFEEYLAARALLESVVVADADAEIHRRASDPGWREVLRLALASVSQKEAQRLLLHLLAAPTDEKDRGRPVVLAGECLQDIGRNGATQRAWRAVTAALLGALTDPQVPLLTRVDAGHVLGRLGDPRLLDLRTGEAQGYGDYEGVPGYWCSVEKGIFWFGDERVKDKEGKTQRNEDGMPQRDLTQLKQVDLPYSFRIARHPVTNAEYALFLAANGPDGYDFEKPWWTEEGRKFLFHDGQRRYTEPNYWDDARFNSPAQPVVGISWYEAAAYCRWLTAIGHERGWLTKDQEIRLPTSLEWERAARHTDQRPFPWGEDAPTGEHANYNITSLGTSSPVGCFLDDRAACGALDVAGNVCEWTSTDFAQIEAIQARKDFTTNERVDYRSSAWNSDLEWMCCGARGFSDPFNWNGDVSFRVVRSLRAHE